MANETEGRQLGDFVDEREGDQDPQPAGSGGSLFKRAFSGEPEDSGVRAWLYGSAGALTALALAGLSVRRWRRRH